MDKPKGKVAVVTGASSGIGASIVKDLLQANWTVVGLARRVERVQALQQELDTVAGQRLHPMRCDVTQEPEVARVFAEIGQRFGPIQVLVNNAGCLRTGQLCRMDASEVDAVWQTNVMGVVHCTRHAFTSMEAGGGHVILINSIVGHKVPVIPGQQMPSLSMYPATKFAVTAMNEIYRQEFRALGNRIKVTSISPGLVDTELISEQQKSICHGKMLMPEDISRAVMFVLSTPEHVHIYEMIIKPAGDLI